MTRFVVDERSIDLNGLQQEEAFETIELLLDCIENAQVNGHGVCCDDELFSIAILGKKSFWELCDYSSPICLSHEIRERAAALFSRLPRWYDLATKPPEVLEVVVADGEVEITASVSWAVQNSVGQGILSSACLCARGRRTEGPTRVKAGNVVQTIWFANSEQGIEQYFRWLVDQYANSVSDFVALAPYAFKNIDFVEGCFAGIKSMSKPVRQLAPALNRHLAAFSDDGERIFKGSWQDATAEFGALNVNVSDENGNTKSNARAKSEREIVFRDEKIVCWWHSKLEKHQDRIHFYPNKMSSGGRLVVGIFAKHLTT